MSSIRSVLIQTCMATIHKELQQLEQWLLRVPDNESTSMTDRLDCLSKQMNAQQYTLNHIMDRIDVLEGVKEIHIDENLDELESPSDLSSPDLFEQVYMVQKNDVVYPEQRMEDMKIATKEDMQEPVEVKPKVELKQKVELEQKVEAKSKVELEQKVEAKVEAKVEEEEVEEVEEEEVEEVEEVEEEEEEEEEEEVEEEEEEEDAVELEEIKYSGKSYYKDNENNIYELDDQDEPVLIGLWNEKKQIVKFFNKS